MDLDADRTRQSLLRYELLERLGSGAHGEGFLALRVADGERVFIKILKASLSEDAEWARRFADEVSVLSSCVHPHIVRYIETFRNPEGAMCLVTEYLEGEDLQARLRKSGALPARHALQLALPLCEALDYLHGRDVVHRDLTPSNILVSGRFPDVTPRLLDFGLAWSSGPRQSRTGAALALTPQYAAPECLAGARATAQSDLYSLGVILYEAMSGAPPFVAGSASELVALQKAGNVASLRGDAAVLFPVIRRCLSTDPKARWGSAGELMRALESAGGRVGQDASAELSRSAAAPVEARSPLGRVGNYDLVKELGSGGMGKVYLARHARLGRQVAIKMLRAEAMADRDAVTRFFMEARTVNAINHEHIVEIFDFVEDEGPPPRIYCVMELLVGESLSKVRKSGPLPLERILHIARQVADALAAAHRAGVVHRDVKPANIMVTTRSGVRDYVKVLDFGVAKVNSLLPGGGTPSVNTQTGLSLGTPDYMSPEQITASPVDGRTDVFALGVLLYELVSGYRPFVGSNVAHLVVKVVREPHTPVPERTTAGEPVPAALKRLIERCLEKDREARPQTMEEISATLERMLQMHRSKHAHRAAIAEQQTEVRAPKRAPTPVSGNRGSGPFASSGGALRAETEVMPTPAPDLRAGTIVEQPASSRGMGANVVAPPAARGLLEGATVVEQPVTSLPPGMDALAAAQALAAVTRVDEPAVAAPSGGSTRGALAKGRPASAMETRVDAPAVREASERGGLPGWLRYGVPLGLLLVGLLGFLIWKTAHAPATAASWTGSESTPKKAEAPTPKPRVPEALPVTVPLPQVPSSVPVEPHIRQWVQLKLTSTPEGASVLRKESGERLGTTPLELRLPASDEPLAVYLELEGHLRHLESVELNAGDVQRSVRLRAEAPTPKPRPRRPRPKPTAPKVNPNATLDPFDLP